MQKQRPVYLDLPKIRLPIPGIVSILHRISGVLLFIFLPVFLWLFSGTLNHADNFATYHHFVANPLVKLILLGFLWLFFHHLCAGIRFLLLDMHYGTSLQTARLTAKIALVCGIVLALIVGVWLW